MTDVAGFVGTREPRASDPKVVVASTDAVVIGSTDELGLVGRDFTVEAWVWVGPHDANDHFDLAVLGTNWDGRANTGLHLTLRHRRVRMGFFGNDTDGNRELRMERWYHVAWRYADRTQTVFINGLVDGFNRSRAPFAGGGLDVTLGMAQTPWDGRVDSFVGRISELRIWDHGVSDELIRRRWTRRVDPDEPGLNSYWPLDDVGAKPGPVDRRRDAIGDVIGSPARIDDDELPIFPRKEIEGIRFGAAPPTLLTFEWTRALIPPDVTRFAVEAWVRPADPDQEPWSRPVVSQHGPSTGWELRAGTHGELMVTIGQRHVELRSATPLRRDVWQHLLGVYDRESLTLYVNGVRDATLAVSGDPVWYEGPLSIASNPYFGGRRYHGVLGDVRVWVNARADPLVLSGSLMWEGVASDDPGPQVQFRLGTEIEDDAWRARILEQGLELERFSAPPIRSQNPGDPIVVERESVGSSVPATPPAGTARETLAVEHARALQRIAELEQEVERQKSEVSRLERSLDVRKAAEDLGDDETTLDEFVRDTRKRIEEARRDIASGQGNYRLGRVTIQAKVLPGAKGRSIRFPGAGQVDGGLLSTIDLEFETAGAVDGTVSEPTVPDVRGYTEPKARRELVGAGYAAETSYQAVATDAETDRVIDQYPVPGITRKPGTSVIIFIGKKS